MKLSKKNQIIIVVSIFFLATLILLMRNEINTFFASNHANAAIEDKAAYVYESYDGNTVKNPTWTQQSDDMVLVDIDGISPYFIDKYEAVISQRQAWSVPGQVPTTKITFQGAMQACEKAGKRICSTQEWRVACRDGSVKKRYFNNTKEMLRDCDFGPFERV